MYLCVSRSLGLSISRSLGPSVLRFLGLWVFRSLGTSLEDTPPSDVVQTSTVVAKAAAFASSASLRFFALAMRLALRSLSASFKSFT